MANTLWRASSVQLPALCDVLLNRWKYSKLITKPARRGRKNVYLRQTVSADWSAGLNEARGDYSTLHITRKHRQSYRHADSRRRRQQQPTVVAARVNRDGFRKCVALTFDLLTSGSMLAERLL